jgi:hypothetical protein
LVALEGGLMADDAPRRGAGPPPGWHNPRIHVSWRLPGPRPPPSTPEARARAAAHIRELTGGRPFIGEAAAPSLPRGEGQGEGEAVTPPQRPAPVWTPAELDAVRAWNWDAIERLLEHFRAHPVAWLAAHDAEAAAVWRAIRETRRAEGSAAELTTRADRLAQTTSPELLGEAELEELRAWNRDVDRWMADHFRRRPPPLPRIPAGGSAETVADGREAPTECEP